MRSTTGFDEHPDPEFLDGDGRGRDRAVAEDARGVRRAVRPPLGLRLPLLQIQDRGRRRGPGRRDLQAGLRPAGELRRGARRRSPLAPRCVHQSHPQPPSRMRARPARAGAARRRPGEDHADAAVGRAEAALLGPALAQALDGIPEPDRDALLLMAWHDLSYAEVAEALDVPPGTVRSRISRARLRLRAQLNRLGVTRSGDALGGRRRPRADARLENHTEQSRSGRPGAHLRAGPPRA